MSMPQSFNLALAPSQLTQTINPWSWSMGNISLLSVNLGQSSDPAFEARVLEQVGSYGRQIGRLGEALAVVLDRLDALDGGQLDESEASAVAALRRQVSDIGQLKNAHARHQRSSPG